VTSVTAGNQNLFTDSAANITYNPSTNTLTTTTFSGALSGSITSATTAVTQATSDNSTKLATTAFVQAIKASLHPVGSIYINATNATNPGTLLGFGTWVAFGAGRVPVGFDAANPLFDAAEKIGGSADSVLPTHTHTATSTVSDPGHSHPQQGYASVSVAENQGIPRGGIQTQPFAPTDPPTAVNTTGISVATTNANAGVSATNGNYQPYITVYMWKRTA
jgi:hypothetical protein